MSLLFSGRLVAVIKSAEDKIAKIPMSKVVLTIGLILGLLVATLLTIATDAIVSISWLASIISAFLCSFRLFRIYYWL